MVMRTVVGVLLALQGSVILAQVGAPPGAAQSAAQAESSQTGLWLVELSSPPAADGGSLTTVRADHAAFRRRVAAAGIRFGERFAFETLFNGLSIRTSRADANRIATLTGVSAVWPVTLVEAPEPRQQPSADLFTALAMTGADTVQNTLGYTGAGVRVAVMDSGIDYHHPDLGGCFGEGCRVATGWDFVGDAYNPEASAGSLEAAAATPVYDPVPHPDPDPDDCGGHGTHVAGIVGANGAIKGVAPGVTFGAYRVFGCIGPTTSDIMIAAMERALADEMQVLNMSIGSSYQWPQYPTAMAASRLVNAGVVVVASIGNSGARGVFAAGAPAVGQKVIGVASFDNTHVKLATFTITPDGTSIGYRPASSAPAPPTSGTYPMARTGNATSTADACSELTAGSLSGHVVLIRRGTCSLHEKARNAQNAGAAGVVLYNDVAGTLAADVAGPPAIGIPVVAISNTDGGLIDSRVASGTVSMTWTNETPRFPTQTGGLISSFSSYGLSPDLALKPDIGAPGGFIYSTLPLERGGYATFSGTSMASPHVVGAVALLLQARPETPSQAVRAILQNSADPKLWREDPSLGVLDNVHRQGAGLLDIDDAILAAAKIEPGALSLGEGEAGPQTRTLRIANQSAAPVTFDLSYVNALSTGGVTTPTFLASDASVGFDAASVTVPARGTALVAATIMPATGPEHGQYGGYIIFTPRGGGPVYRVPFAGFVGDYQQVQVLLSTPNNTFPHVTRLIPGSCTRLDPETGECFGSGFYSPGNPEAPFTMTGTDFPYFAMYFAHQARSMMIDVYDVSGKAWHRALREEYLPRNSTADNFSVFFWDGTTAAGNKTYQVPDGQYIVKLSLLKALGDKANPAHWETWTSPVITIDRP
jgi:minor extracellular serine protease Vpr